MAYTPYGPWTDGGAPGVSAEFLNPLESFLQTVNSAATDSNISAASGILTMLALSPNPTAVTVTGTAGTATLYQPLQGSVKLLILSLSGYQNSSSTEQTIHLPVPFTSKAWVFTGNFQGGMKLTPYYGGSASANNVRVFTGLGGGGGTGTLLSQINAFSIAQITGHFDAIGLGASETVTTTDMIFIIGM